MSTEPKQTVLLIGSRVDQYVVTDIQTAGFRTINTRRPENPPFAPELIDELENGVNYIVVLAEWENRLGELIEQVTECFPSALAVLSFSEGWEFEGVESIAHLDRLVYRIREVFAGAQLTSQ